MDQFEMVVRSDPEYEYDILPQEYYANPGGWRKRSDDYDILSQEYYANPGGWRKRSEVGKGTNQKELILKNNLNHLARQAKRRKNRNKSKQQKLAVKYYPVFF
jgi:hypothetical protein